jgi:hypothetical protein
MHTSVGSGMITNMTTDAPELTIEDYVKNVFKHDDTVTIENAYIAFGSHDVATSMNALLREMLNR